MRLLTRRSLLVIPVLAALWCLPHVAASQDAPASGTAFESTPLFARMKTVNIGLRTYKARVHVDVKLKTFPFLSPSLDGTAYYKQPDRNAIDFDSVPMLASALKNVFPRLPSPAQWPRLFTMTLQSDTDGTSNVRLVPRKNGRVDHLDVAVDDQHASPVSYTYSYREGGTVHFDEELYEKNGYQLVKTLSGNVDLPQYKADAAASFSGYQINVPVADAQVDGNTASAR